jgi:hypothetical protein
MAIWRKDPADVGWYTFKWDGAASDGSRYLATGETIDTYTVTVAAGLTKDADQLANSDTWVMVKVSGGVDNADIDVTCQIVTTDEQTWETTKKIQVRERRS